MEKISTIRDLVELWPTRAEFASDLGVPIARVHKWVSANTIPAKYQRAVVDSGSGRGIAVTADLIVNLHASPKSNAA